MPMLVQTAGPGRRGPPGLFLAAFLCLAVLSREAPGGVEPPEGERLYRERCASCHGASGEGVQSEYSEPLVGDRSLPQLTRYIERRMPDGDPDACAGEDAAAVARYVYDAFYSPIARARNRPPRIELSRLTVRQFRNAITDLVGSFRGRDAPGEERGLRAEYFNSRRPGRDRVLERTDARVKFDFGRADPIPDKLDAVGFSARWEGSVIAPDTGSYEFVVRTDQAARLWLNDLDTPLIDAWVKSGDETEYRGSLFLLGGRPYPLRLEFTSRDQGVRKDKKNPEPVKALVELGWKLPEGGATAVIPSRQLIPQRTAELFVAESPFPPDDSSEGYERGTAISKAWDDATTGAAIEAADYIADHLPELAGLNRSEGAREPKVREFCGRLLERAFRRPPGVEERRLYLDRQFADAPALETAVKRVVLLALKSPRFLYLDIAGPRPDGYTVASRMSFAIWDSLPDRALLEAAATDKLLSRAEVARQAERMIPDPRTRSKIRLFLHGWLGLEHGGELAKDEETFPGFDEALAGDLRASLDLFLDEVIWQGDADFRRLLLSRELYLNGRLARFYGFDLPEDAPFQKVTSERPARSGVLTHPYVMARFAYRETSSPIHRGVFLLRGVLGRPLRPPPEAFAPFDPDLHPDLTTRERVELQTGPDFCQGCHRTINALGFTLETFDAVGRFRDREKGKPVDTTGFYELASGDLRRLGGPRELIEFVAGSEDAHRSFVVQLFHHLVKQPILAYGPEVPEDLQRAFTAADFNVRILLREIITTAALKQLVETVDAGRTHRDVLIASAARSN